MLIETIILIVGMLLSAAVTGGVCYLLAKRYFDNQQKISLLRMREEEHGAMVKQVTPLRLQAYERMALFLERIAPESLVLRCYQPGMDTQLLQGVLTKNIRDEWEHNLSQQIYLSDKVWQQIRAAKDEMIGVVNSAAITIPADADPTRLAGAIFASVAGDKLPTIAAMKELHEEMEKI